MSIVKYHGEKSVGITVCEKFRQEVTKTTVEVELCGKIDCEETYGVLYYR